jgi:HD-like signal output (HDOD) protein
MADIADLLKSVALPVMPKVGLALIATLDDDDTPLSKIQSLIGSDPTLTTKLLALANSAAFGLPRRVATLDNALSLVGLSKVRTMALSACLHNAFSMPEGIDGAVFWRFSVSCAGFAQWLAEGVGADMAVDRQKAWLTGLMLRLGELLIAQALPQVAAEIEQLPCGPGERWNREKKLCGFDEGEVTAELARQWNFPADIVRALVLASDPLVEKPVSPMAGVVHLAARLADLPQVDPDSIDTLPVPVMSALALKYGWLKTNFPNPDKFLNIATLAR